MQGKLLTKSLRDKLIAALAERDLLASSTETVYGQPMWRTVAPEREPEALMDATALQRRLVECAHATPAKEGDRCAAWVEAVFARLGHGVVCGDASALYHSYCSRGDTVDLRVGMIVAVPVHPYGAGGRGYGHVGIYIGDDRVMDCADGRVRTIPLELWLSAYGVMAEPRWGWLGSIALG